ncbi:MAG: DUF3237 domain-containing protein [Alphaproteobacteria bacterium]|nr:DUF3237 domain-containing protein [Alphaproteobacteria bacterium]
MPGDESLPEALRSIHTRPLFTLRLKVRPIVAVGATPGAHRRIGLVSGGTFAGERLRGEVLDGGSDWLADRADGATTLDVRLILRTADGALIAMTYRGIRHGPPDAMRKLSAGEPVAPDSYYFRIAPLFETAAPQYGWLNRVLAIGIGDRPPEGPVYNIFEIL